MAQPLLSLYIDVQNRQLVQGFTNPAPVILPAVYQGDTLNLWMRFMQPTGNNTSPYADIDYSTASVTVAVGNIGAAPTSGLFTLTDTGASQTTSALLYNSTAAQVQTAIQTYLTTNWSNATITGNRGGPFSITNGSNGSKTALVGTSLTLNPLSSVVINRLQEGSSSQPEIQTVSLSVNPIALQNTFSAYSTPAANVSRLQSGSGSQNEIQQIALGNQPYAGTFTVSFGSYTSAAIVWNATAAQVQTALQAMTSIGNGNVSVGGSAGAWVVTFTGTLGNASQTLMTTNAGALVGPLALTGTLALNTAGIEEAMGNYPQIAPALSIQVIPLSGSAFTVYQNNFTIENDLIVGAPAIPTPGVSYYTTVESDARYKGQGVYVERDATGNTAQHINTSAAGANDIMYLLSNNASGEAAFTFDNGTFDGQTLTIRSASNLTNVTFSENVNMTMPSNPYWYSGCVFAWDNVNSQWDCIGV